MTASHSPTDARTAASRWLWLALLLLAAALRLPGADWDGGIAAHPDERFLVDTAVATPLLGDPTVAAPDFPYGHLPLYLLRLLVLAAPGADPLYAGHLFSALLGVLLVAATGALGKRLLGERGGLWAAVLVAGSPFLLQSARFYTVDIPAALAATLALLFALRRRSTAAAILWGLAVACKVSLVVGGLPLAFALLNRPQAHSPAPAPSLGAPRVAVVPKALLRLTLFLFLPALLSFALVSPWAWLRPLAAWRGPWIQSLMVAGRLDFPYTRQYAGTSPFLYPLLQLGWWGLGPTATLAGFAGLLAGAWRWRRLSPDLRVAWSAAVVGFVMLAGWYVKFPRYLLPVYPLWAIWGIWFLARLDGHLGRRLVRAAAWVGVLLPTLLLGIAQLSIYTQPHPWVLASRWIYAQVPEQGRLAVEHWDHPLPVPLPEGDPARYGQLSLPVMDEESPEKLAQLEAALQDSDVIILASARGYGALARQPDRYPVTLEWYARLLQERTLLAFGRCPRLGPLALSDDPLLDAGLPAPLSLAERCGTPWALRLPHLDESFRVYDAPVALLALR
ncbi:MAG: hypothetical protein BWY25_02916 [Chloroflexi bacterium ADurb.Bin222]|nr:MAG: hypothetical protein BWY25_02916 [Chloroflexi bacterium ADurb.Bin222]